MRTAVGIDLGTTYSAVAWINPESGKPEIIRNSFEQSTTPSVIQFLEDGSHVCGQEAKESFDMGEENCACAFKRNMGTNTVCMTVDGREYRAEELSSMLLRHLKEEAELRIKRKVTDAVITVPAYFFNEERASTIRAAQAAGLNVLRIINEPTAAALNYSIKHWRENAVIMVYDLGGGTFDCTLIGMGPRQTLDSLGTNGDHKLGGKDWDAALAKLVLDKLFAEKGIDLRSDCEAIDLVNAHAEEWKRKLSQPGGIAKCKFFLRSCGRVELNITRAEFEERTASLLARTVSLCETVLKEAHLTWRNITDILLVGGSTRMPQVQERLTQLTGKQPIAHVHPDEAVAIGAAMQTTMQQEEYEVYTSVAKMPAKKGAFTKQAPAQKTVNDNWSMSYVRPVQKAREIDNFATIMKRDVQAHGMGLITVNSEGTAYINENIIPSNMRVPIKCAKAFHFHTSPRGENKLELYVVEGDGEPSKANIKIKYVATGIKHVQGKPARMRVQYSFDRNSIIHVQVRQDNDNVDLPIYEEPVTLEEIKRFGEPIDPKSLTARNEMTIVLSIDVSGSMEGSPIADAKSAMISFVEKYADSGARIGVIATGSKTQWVIKPTDNLTSVKQAIQGVRTGMAGYASSAHPFGEFKSVMPSGEGMKFGVVLADGQWENQSTAIREAKSCHARGIEIAAIGFGTADERFLREISSRRDLSIMTEQSRLTQSFGTIAQSIGKPSGMRFNHRQDMSATETWETND